MLVLRKIGVNPYKVRICEYDCYFTSIWKCITAKTQFYLVCISALPPAPTWPLSVDINWSELSRLCLVYKNPQVNLYFCITVHSALHLCTRVNRIIDCYRHNSLRIIRMKNHTACLPRPELNSPLGVVRSSRVNHNESTSNKVHKGK